MGRVDVGAQPQAGVGHAHRRPRHVRGEPADRAVARVHGPLLRGREVASLHAQAVEPGARQRVVVVAGHERHAPVGGHLAQALEQGACQLDQVGHAPLAQLEHVAEQHHVVGAGQRLHEPVANGREPNHVGPAQQPEVEVGDHGEVHGRDGRSPTSVSGACRASAATTGFWSTARSAPRTPCWIPAGRRPRPAHGRAPRAHSAGRRASRAHAVPTRLGGPVRRAAPRCASSACPAGCAWPSGRRGRSPCGHPSSKRPTSRRCWPTPRRRGSSRRRTEAGDAAARVARLRRQSRSHGRDARRATRGARGRRPRANRALDPQAERGLAAAGGAGDAAGGALPRGDPIGRRARRARARR